MRPVSLFASTLILFTLGCSSPQPIDMSRPDTRSGAAADPREPWTQPVPKAQCAADDREETALQGQVPLVDRVSGRAEQGYTCNLELVGQHQGEGAGWQLAWFEDCAYMGTANGEGQVDPGVVVFDVTDPTQPVPTRHLSSLSMLDPWESLKVNERRSLLGAVDGAGGTGTSAIDLYDISTDCTQPVLLASEQVGTRPGHAGNFSPDGLTYYGSGAGADEVRAIDVSDPRRPALITEDFPNYTHDLSISDDGNRFYAAQTGASAALPNGLVIMDVSDIQARKPDPEVRVISEMYWPDAVFAQITQPITIAGHPYLFITDELGTRACNPATGELGYGITRIIDIADEANPRLVAKLMLEVHDPMNCAETVIDDQSALFLYDSHYCSVDDIHDAEVMACGHFASGLRVFDIRDPYLPREIAYYIPPARPDDTLPGSNRNGNGSSDFASSHPRFVPERGEIWFSSHQNGFQVVRFKNGVWPFE